MKTPESLGHLSVDALTETDARNICSWRYPPPYDVYDYADWDTVVRSEWDLSLPEKRAADYVGFRIMDGLVAFGRLTGTQEYVLIGIGLRPDFCGVGLGKRVMTELIALAHVRYPHQIPALEVRTFNARAIRCYEGCGFKKTRQYVRNTLTGEEPFYFMVYRP